VYCEEIWSLEDRESIEALKPIYGLVFLFKYKTGEKPVDRSCQAPHVYFAKQVINNACGTQALINILLNATDQVDVGDQLKGFLEFTQALDPESRGEAIGSFDAIRECHNSFARHQNFSFEEQVATADDDVFHFIGYVPKDGMVYELDGLQRGPIEVGKYSNDWIPVANVAIQERIATYSQGEIRFNLLALCANPVESLKQQLAEMQAAGNADTEYAAQLRCKVEDLEERRRKWSMENARRRHNYIPFIYHLLKLLAEKDKLKPLVEQAVIKTKADKEKKAAKDKEDK
jgi:ubiquitin carboxyl-terminal hydrolase L5